MKILILNWRDPWHPKSGGAELVTMEHAKGWVKKGHSVTWLTSWYKGASANETRDGMHIVRRSGSLLIYLYGFLHVIKYGSAYDVIVDEFHGLTFLSPLATHTPVVAFIHEIADEIWDYMAPFPLSVFGKFLEKFMFRFYKNVYFWTDAESTILELQSLGISRNRCIAIPCPLPTQPPTIPSFMKNKQFTCIFVSRVVAMKGIEEVIKAFSYIRKEVKDANLCIVGSGDERYIRKLRSLVDKLFLDNSVIWYGKVSEEMKYKLLAESHLLLHASVKEGWGLVVLEAASVGTPSIVYNVNGLRDVVQHNKTGIIVSDNNPILLAKEAIKLYKDQSKYKHIQKEGKEWSTSFSWNNVIDRSEALLKRARYQYD